MTMYSQQANAWTLLAAPTVLSRCTRERKKEPEFNIAVFTLFTLI
jgi:hypothetical protein